MGKYPNYGILDALEKLSSGGWESFKYHLTKDKPRSVSRDELLKMLKKRQREYSSRMLSKKLYTLKAQGLVIEYVDGGLQLDEAGQQRLELAELSNITFRNKKTDGSSRLIIFDIPEQRRDARDMLRRKLKEFECRQLQKSVYITPYVCEDEIGEIARILNVAPHIHVLKVVETTNVPLFHDRVKKGHM